jgi:hypothetical protein
MSKAKAILFVCAMFLLAGAMPSFGQSGGGSDYVIVAMIQHQNGYQCRHMPQAEWDVHFANNTLPAGRYYNVYATLQQLNSLHIWGMHATIEEVQQVFQQNNMVWPSSYYMPNL